jgi:uncharacterized protein (TIGR03437 family)
MGFFSRFLPATGILAAFALIAPAQTQTTTTPITLNFNVDYVLGTTENTYTGTGTITPFGNATLQGTETFTTGIQISVTFTVANGSSFQATATSASLVAGGCAIPFTIAGGSGAFTNATGSITVIYACSSNVPESGSFQASGTGSITTMQAGGTFSVSPSALAFSFPQGGNSSSQQITLNNGTALAVPFTAAASAESWLSVSPTSGSVPALQISLASVTVNPAGLAPGTYTGTVTISAVGQQFPVSITVTINAAPQTLRLSQTSLRFQVAVGAGAPPSQSIVVLNQGTGTLNWSASASTLSGSWLSVTPASGTSGASATVTINPANLTRGDYYGLVQFTSSGASNSPQSVVVVLNVLPATTVVATVAPAGLIFIAPQGGSPAAQTVTVANSSNQAVTVNATAVSQPNGVLTTNLSSANVSSAQPAEFMVTANVSGLNPGVYTGVVQFEFAGGSTQVVTIRIIVTGASPRNSIGGQAAASSCTPTQLVPVSTILGSNFSATAAWPTAMQIQVVDDCGSPMGPGDVIASFSTSDPPLALTSLGSGFWSGTWQPEFVSASTPVVITVSAQSAQPALTGTLQINGTLQNNPTVPSIGGVVSTASYVPNAPLAPGAFASIFGENLATSSILAGKLPLTTQLAGAQAFIAGVLAPIQYASDGQINFLVPFGLAPNSTQQLIVLEGSAYSTPKPLTIAPAQPAVFTQDQSGKGSGAITVVKTNGTQFSADPSHPASAGDTLVIYCAGLGAVTPFVATGAAAPSSPPAKASSTVTVTIGGQPATVAFAGLTPTYAGLYQVNVTVPSGITPGPSVPVIITAAGLSSPPVTVAIQ